MPLLPQSSRKKVINQNISLFNLKNRNIPQNISEGLFKYLPRNKNIRCTFKAQSGLTPNDS